MYSNLIELIDEHKHLNVLYVEDDDNLRQSTLNLLKNYFTNIDIARDGKEGLEQYISFNKKHNKTYDIVITDITMPHVTGIEMSKIILEINSKQVIIVISAHNDSTYLLDLINIGISKFILKPIDVKQLTSVIIHIFNSIKQEKIIEEQYKDIERINKELKKANKKEMQASRHKSEFLANMSHEIRTPLNAIIGFISLLEEGEKDTDKLKYMEIIKSSSDSLVIIINDILDISKIESGQIDMNYIDFEPLKEINNVVELFKAKALEKNITLSIAYSDNIPKILNSDPFRIKQILVNLLSNAIKFTPKNLSISCFVYYKDEQLFIEVKDKGIGIAQNKQEYIFDTFTQAESSTTRSYGGTGLGLAISKSLAKMLNGTIALKSELGKGSTFTLNVKVKVAKNSILEKTTTISNHNKLVDKHILVVEDIEANRMFIGVILKNIGLSYDVAKDGLEAIDKFKNNTYDLILMDENMPKVSGTEATKKILSIEKEITLTHTPIIALTANALYGDKDRFIEAGMDDYLTKPLAPATLLNMLKKYLS